MERSEIGCLASQAVRAGDQGIRWSLATLTLAALASCGGPSPPSPEAQVLPPAAPTPAAPPAASPPSSTITSGFTPLPTPQQVLATTPERRIDPFAPLSRPASPQSQGRPGATPPLEGPLTLPPGFQFNGVVSVGGLPQALVTYGPQSGSLSPGDQGGRSTPLLPPGWSVASIDAGSGRLLLRQGKRTISARLTPAVL